MDIYDWAMVWVFNIGFIIAGYCFGYARGLQKATERYNKMVATFESKIQEIKDSLS